MAPPVKLVWLGEVVLVEEEGINDMLMMLEALTFFNGSRSSMCLCCPDDVREVT